MTIQQRERRNGVKMVQVKLPAISRDLQDITKAVEDAITPKTKLMVISQVSFLNGQIFPIREIAALARRHGIPFIVDGAHAFVQFKFDNHDLECDMYATRFTSG